MKWPNGGDHQPAYQSFNGTVGKRLMVLGESDELAFTVQGFNREHGEFRMNYRNGTPKDGYLVERRVFLTYRVKWLAGSAMPATVLRLGLILHLSTQYQFALI